ncbi:MAG TPA: hypothetical protein VKB63_13680, partial [Gemmatimonadales bacterium]|nr:hypothetical protein [Gemmatimonadales bacterium]
MVRIPPQVYKFGGASLESGPAIAHAISIIRAQRPAPLVVVVSAMAGVTDALLELASAASRGEAARAVRAAGALHTKHVAAARTLLRTG